ncbi:MAG: hypothetical protein F6K58_08760 [Symploca sp. SIO2E9]|nr:hypothetical protein [Symploca sp. SIO2E9]
MTYSFDFSHDVIIAAPLPSTLDLVADAAEEFESFKAQVYHALRERGVTPVEEESIDSEFIQRYGNEILFLEQYRVQKDGFAENTPEMSVALKSALAKMKA